LANSHFGRRRVVAPRTRARARARPARRRELTVCSRRVCTSFCVADVQAFFREGSAPLPRRACLGSVCNPRLCLRRRTARLCFETERVAWKQNAAHSFANAGARCSWWSRVPSESSPHAALDAQVLLHAFVLWLFACEISEAVCRASLCAALRLLLGCSSSTEISSSSETCPRKRIRNRRQWRCGELMVITNATVLTQLVGHG